MVGTVERERNKREGKNIAKRADIHQCTAAKPVD